jgi:hypothetical protein
MGRSGPELTREHADKIVRKLKATVEAGRAHDLAIVHYQGTPVVQFGIRRASRKDEGHGHLSGQLSLPAFQVQRLGELPDELRRMGGSHEGEGCHPARGTFGRMKSRRQ